MTDIGSEAERGEKPALGAYFIIPLLACGLTAYYLLSTIGLIWEAKSTGIFIGVILLALCIAQIIRLSLQIVRGRATLGFGDLFENSLFNRQRFILLALTTTFVVSLPLLGTTVGLFVLLIASTYAMGVREWRKLIAVAFVTAATVHFLLIYLLGSQLPQGVFKRLFAAIGI